MALVEDELGVTSKFSPQIDKGGASIEVGWAGAFSKRSAQAKHQCQDLENRAVGFARILDKKS